MKKILFLLCALLSIGASAQVSAQTILMGDTNSDGQLSIADVTSTVNMVLGKSPALTVDLSGMAYRVDNSGVAGRWKAPDNSRFTLNADGTTDYPGAATYEFRPFQGTLLFCDALGNPVRMLHLAVVASDHLLAVDCATQGFTLYTNDSRVTSIALSSTSLMLNSGATAQLTATVTPSDALNPSLQWTSSDESVATVSPAGLVTAVAGGTATITCTATDGSGVSATCQVTVTQLVTSITLSHTTLVLEVDGYQKLTATVLPSNAANTKVTWTSSDEDVAEVTSTGGVAAVGIGSCTITCTARDGSGLQATCQVHVRNLVTSVTLNYSSLELDVDETQTLSATVLPSDATLKTVSWTSSNTAVATVTNAGLVSAVSAGSAVITCTARDGSGVKATCQVTVSDPDSHEYVDLGLPSGTLWATHNVGATNPEDYGAYFVYKTELDLSDDAAYVPTIEQFYELINSSYTTSTWTTVNGVNGYKITSKSNGNSIFLPAAGYRGGTSLLYAGSQGYYWSRTPDTKNPGYAYALFLFFNSSSISTGGMGDRYNRGSVRPVRLSN